MREGFSWCVCSKAFDLHLSVGILRLQEGLDLSQHETASKTKNSTESLPRNQSYSQMSQGRDRDVV